MPACRFLGRRQWAAILSVALLAVPARAGAVAPVGPEVTIISPTPDQAGSGNVDFTVAINQPDSADRVDYVELYLVGGGSVIQEQAVTVPVGQCAPTCTITRTFDTSTLVVPTSLLSRNVNLPDGLTQFLAAAHTSSGAHTDVSGTFTLDNHRPTLELPDLSLDQNFNQIPPLGGDERLHTTVTVHPNASSGQPVTNLRLMVPYSPVSPLANLTLPAPVGGSGQLDVDLSTVHQGYYTGYLAAIDSAGQASALVRIVFSVDHYQITAAVAGTFYSDFADIIVTPNWTDRPADTWIDSIDGYFDGVLVGHNNGFGHPHVYSDVVLHHVGSAFPVGNHTVRLVVTDNRGIRKELSIPVRVVDPISVSWQVLPAATGEPSKVTVRADSANSSIISTTLADERGVFARIGSGGAMSPMNAAGFVTETSVGTHQLTATVVEDDGSTYQFHHSLVVVQAANTAAYLVGSRTGSIVRLNGLIKEQLAGTVTRADDRLVFVQRLLAGHWQTILVRASDRLGRIAVGFIQTRPFAYRLYVSASRLAHAATSGSTVR